MLRAEVVEVSCEEGGVTVIGGAWSMWACAIAKDCWWGSASGVSC